MTFTDNEKEAIVALIDSCMATSGEPIDHLGWTWVDVEDLTDAGWDQKSAEGTFGSLVAKRMIYIDPMASAGACPFFIDEKKAAPIWKEAKQCHTEGCKNQAEEDYDLCHGCSYNQSHRWLWGSDAP